MVEIENLSPQVLDSLSLLWQDLIDAVWQQPTIYIFHNNPLHLRALGFN
jgi:hypothetical protein